MENWKDIYDYTVKTSDMDYYKDLKLNVLLDWIQDSAANSAYNYNHGTNDLDYLNLSWLIQGYSVRLNRIVSLDEKIKVATWPNPHKLIFFPREFYFLDNDGSEFGAATINYFLADRDNHRPYKVQDERFKRPDSIQENSHLPFPCYRARGTFDQPLKKVMSVEARYNDIDINSHVNNIKYVEWAINGLAKGLDVFPKIYGVDVNYINELKFKESVDIYMLELDPSQAYNPPENTKTVYVEARRADNDVCFKAQIHYTTGEL